MKLYFKQRLFSWFDSYDIYDETGNTVYIVKGQIAWGHLLKIMDPSGREIGAVREKILTFLPRFELYAGNSFIGTLKKEFTFFRPRFSIDCNGWYVEGGFMEWDYVIHDQSGRVVATISKELFHWTDHYVMDIANPGDSLLVLMFVLSMDAEKCSRDN